MSGLAAIETGCMHTVPTLEVSSHIAVQEKQVRKQLQKKIVLETRKDGTKFTSEKLKASAQRLHELTKQYTDVQRTLVDSVRVRRPHLHANKPCSPLSRLQRVL